MEGVCPKCVDYHSDVSVCPECGSALLSASEWKAKRSVILSRLIVPEPVERSVSPVPAAGSKAETTTIEEKKDFVLGFFLGALLFFLALISSYLVFADYIRF